MTLEGMIQHEALTLRYGTNDYRRTGMIKFVRPLVTGRRVLDMRCLGGDLAVGLAEDGFRVTALDGFSGAVEMTNKRARACGVTNEMARPWRLTALQRVVNEEKFDTVICLDLLNHVPDDDETVKEISEVMAPSGRLLLVVPAFPWLIGKRDAAFGHLRRYTRRGLRQLLTRHGFCVERMRYWNFLALGPYVLVEKILRRKLTDKMRYGQDGLLGSWPNRALGWWYRNVENRFIFPCGLTLFVVAQKKP